MSKAHMVVLSFLKAKPFHGYQIGQMVEQLKLPGWTGVTLPAIYKAMQSLEKSKHIKGEEMREGTNPPRMVYHLNSKGKSYLRSIVITYLGSKDIMTRDWWLALHFAELCISKQELLNAIEQRILHFKEAEKAKRNHTTCLSPEFKDKLPFVHAHLLALGLRFIRSELRSLQELQRDVLTGEHDAFFMSEQEVSN